MKLLRRPLLPILIVLFLLTCGIALARSRTAKSNLAPAVAVECADDCKERLDAALEKCDQMPEDSRDNCRRVANMQHEKCLERCNNGKGNRKP